MDYLKATLQNRKPYITWDKWADSIEELAEMGEFENPLIVAADQVPENVFGVCPWKIVDGELVERTTGEMDDFESEYLRSTKTGEYRRAAKDIENEKFTYLGNDYPTHAIARQRYALAVSLHTDMQFMTTDGNIVTITSMNLEAFITAYQTKMLSLTNPDKSEE